MSKQGKILLTLFIFNMRKLIVKTSNNNGDKCKTYVYYLKNTILFYRYTLITNKYFTLLPGGEKIIRQTDNYILTYRWFAIKETTILAILQRLDIIKSIPSNDLDPEFNDIVNKNFWDLI